MEAVMMLKFPPTIEPEDGVKEVNELQKRLQSLFPGFEIIIEKNVAGLEYADTFTGAAGITQNRSTAQDEYVAELRIEGPLND
jgi:hypothetical protein